MRILFIIASSNFGGTETFLLNLIKGLTTAGITVGIVCPSSGIFNDVLDNVYYINTKKLSIFSSLKQISKVVEEFKPDIIHTHLARASYIGLFILLAHKIPVVATVHNVLGGCKLTKVYSKFLFSKNANYVYYNFIQINNSLLSIIYKN